MAGRTKMSIKTVMLHGITKSFMLKPRLAHQAKPGEIAAKAEALDFKEPARNGRSWFNGTDGCVLSVRIPHSQEDPTVRNRPGAAMVLERIGES